MRKWVASTWARHGRQLRFLSLARQFVRRKVHRLARLREALRDGVTRSSIAGVMPPRTGTVLPLTACSACYGC